MKNLLLFFLLALPLLFTNCEENGLFGSGGEDAVPMGEECGAPGTPGCFTSADCNNGRCECPDTSAQLRPGWCLPNYSDHMFVTYDKIGDLVDTSIISFDEDPYAVDWATVNSAFYNLGGSYRLYNRSFHIGDIGFLLPPENSYRTDSINIIPVRHASSGYIRRFEPGGWSCQQTFTGRFTHRDTIKGQLEFLACRRDSITPKPPEAQVTYPMTWVRLKR